MLRISVRHLIAAVAALLFSSTIASAAIMCDAAHPSLCASVKSANSPPDATDPALVVTLSPNSGGSSIVKTSRPAYSNNTQNPLTTGTDGGLILSDGFALGPTTVSSATIVFTFATWGYEYVHIDVSGNVGSLWVLECSDAAGTNWSSQALTSVDRTLTFSVAFAASIANSVDGRISDNQCRVRVITYNPTDSITFSGQLRKTGSEPVVAANVTNTVKIYNSTGSADQFAGWNVATSTYYSSSALESGHPIKAGSGMLTQVCASATAAVTLQIFNSTTVPANATPVSPAPVAWKQIASGAKGCIPDSPGGMAPLGFGTGISVACSTDASIMNKATATSSCAFEVRYQ